MLKHILIVDDSRMARKIVKRNLIGLLGDQDVQIEEADGGEIALAMCRSQEYSLVLLDLTMPDVTGYEVLRRIREEGVKQKVIVLSADVQPGAEAAVRELGAIGFLKKPFELETAAKIFTDAGLL